jgi:hypothetical protein
MRIRFRSTSALINYDGPKYKFKDKQIQHVDEEEGNRLLRQFPGNFDEMPDVHETAGGAKPPENPKADQTVVPKNPNPPAAPKRKPRGKKK